MENNSHARPPCDDFRVRIEWDVPITMDDGIVLRADVFRPEGDARYPVIMTHGPYAKWLAFQDGFARQWANLESEHPDALAGSSNQYQNWETVDPEKWVPDGYVVIRVDSRGAGPVAGLPGHLLAARDARLLRVHRVGRRAAVEHRPGRPARRLLLRDQSVAGRGPAAAAPDRHLPVGRRQRLLPRLHPARGDPQRVRPAVVPAAGRGRAARRGGARPAAPGTGGLAAGPETLTEEELRANRADTPGPADASTRCSTTTTATAARTSARSRCRCCPPRTGRTTCTPGETSRATPGCRARRNGWRPTACSTGPSSTPTTASRLQKRFFGHFLKGEDTGWDSAAASAAPGPPRRRHLRASARQTRWPLPQTQWTKFHLDIAAGQLAERAGRNPAGRPASRPAATG